MDAGIARIALVTECSAGIGWSRSHVAHSLRSSSVGLRGAVRCGAVQLQRTVHERSALCLAVREPQRCRHRTDEPAAATADKNDIGVYGQNDSSVGSRQSGATGPRGLRPQ